MQYTTAVYRLSLHTLVGPPYTAPIPTQHQYPHSIITQHHHTAYRVAPPTSSTLVMGSLRLGRNCDPCVVAVFLFLADSGGGKPVAVPRSMPACVVLCVCEYCVCVRIVCVREHCVWEGVVCESIVHVGVVRVRVVCVCEYSL